MLRFIDGFDFYTITDTGLRWIQANNNNSQSFPSGRYGSGTFSFCTGDQFSAISKQLDNQATFIVGFALKITGVNNLSSGSGKPLLRFYDTGTSQLELSVNSAGQLVISRNNQATTLATGTTGLVSGTWYYIEFMGTINSSISANTCIARIGGVNEIVLAAGTNTRASSNNYANSVAFNGVGNNSLFVIDDVYICDGTGSANNTFLGDVRVECIRPAANGTVTGFTPNTGSNYSNINGTSEDGDTTYNASNTLNAEDTFTFGSLSSNATNIYGIQTTMMARKDDAGSRQIAAIVRHSSTDYAGASVGLPDSYVFFSEVRETNPATSAAWTTSDVNALEAGYKLVG